MIKRLAQILALAVVLLLSDSLSVFLASVGATAIRLSAGIALAALLVLGPRLWPGVLLGGFLSLWDCGAATSLVVTASFALEAASSAWLINRFAKGTEAFDSVQMIFRFIVIAAGAALVCAAPGALGLCHAQLSWSSWLGAWKVRALEDFGGLLVGAPLLVLWQRDRRLPPEPQRWAEAAGVGLVLLTMTGIAFGGWFSASFESLEYLVVPAILWVALRFGQRGAVTATAFVSALVIFATSRHMGPFGGGDPRHALLLLQAFICTLTPTALIVAVIIAERRQAEERLRLQHEIGRMLSESSSVDDASVQLLGKICGQFDWELGLYWKTEDKISVSFYKKTNLEAGKWAEGLASRLKDAGCAKGPGLLNSAWQSGRPAWGRDFAAEATDPVGAILRAEGARSILAFPVSVAGNTAGLVGFFSRRPRRQDAEILAMCAAIADQFGLFIKRKDAEKALRHSESQLRVVWENSTDGMRLVNELGIIIAVNGAYCRIMETSREFLLGKPIAVLEPEERREGSMRRFCQAFHNRQIEPRAETEVTLRNGRKISLELSNSFLEEGRPLLLSAVREITERKRAESLRQEFSLLGQQLSAASTPLQAARTIVAAALKLIGWDACAVDLCSAELDSVVNVLVMDTIHGQRMDVPSSNVDRKITPRLRRAIEEGGYLILHDDIGNLPAPLLPFGDVSRRSASLIIVPIRDRGKVSGVLSLHSYSLKAYTQSDLDTTQALADHCGGALARIRVAEELRLQQEFLRTVFDMAPNLISVKDRQHCFTWVNQAYARFFGKTVEEIIGQTDASLSSHSEEAARSVRDDQEVFCTGRDKIVWEEQCTDASGNAHWLQTTKRPLFGPDGSAQQVLAISTDITERKRVERRNMAFSKLAQRLHYALSGPEAARIIAGAADELFGWDAFTLNLCATLGTRRAIQPLLIVDTIEGKRCEIPSGAFNLSFNPHEQRALDSGGQLILREEPITMGPGLKPFGDTGRPSASLMFVPVRDRTRVLGVISAHSYQIRAYHREDLDVFQALADYCGAALERIRAENALRESDALKGAIMESALDCIITTDREGRIMDFNSAAQCTFGYSRERVIGKELAVLIFPPPFRERHRQALADYVATAETGLLGERVEVSALRADGSEFPAELAVTPLHADAGPIFTAYIRDITERKRAEKAMRELPGQILEAQESERMRVARELHDSVNQILSSTKFRLDSIEPGHLIPTAPAENLIKARELLDRAMHEIWRISRNLRPSELDDLGLIPAVRSLCHEFEDRVGVAVSLSLPQAVELPPEIELTIYRIIQEALNNVEKHSEATEVRLAVLKEPAWLRLRIEDNGIGFKPGGSSSRRKSGMGLVGMKERAAFAGGAVEIHSVAQKGTTIQVRIPEKPA